MQGEVLEVCLNPKKGEKKSAVSSARLIKDWGIQGDAHAGGGPRQVSLLFWEEIEKMKEILPGLRPGDFGENIITRGIHAGEMKIGARIKIGGKVLLEVTQIGKECHSGCAIQRQTGQCIMPEKGIFAKVIQGGVLKKGSTLRIVNPAPPCR